MALSATPSRGVGVAVLAAAVSLIAIAVGPVGTAAGAPPNVTIATPANGSVSSNQTPVFSGLAQEGTQ